MDERRIETLWVFISSDDGIEGILGCGRYGHGPDGEEAMIFAPLITGDTGNLPEMRQAAEDIAAETGVPYRLIRFQRVIEP